MNTIDKNNQDNSIINDDIEDIQIDVDEMKTILYAEADALNVDLDMLENISFD
jgi:hypothetical protein